MSTTSLVFAKRYRRRVPFLLHVRERSYSSMSEINMSLTPIILLRQPFGHFRQGCVRQSKMLPLKNLTVLSMFICRDWSSEGTGRKAAHQQITREWWQSRARFELYISQLVLREASGGDVEAARLRLETLKGIPVLALSSAASALDEADTSPLRGLAQFIGRVGRRVQSLGHWQGGFSAVLRTYKPMRKAREC